MNTALTVKLTGDANDIPIMYRVVEMTVAGTAAGTFCALMVTRVGWDTFANYDKWKATKTYDINSGNTDVSGRDPEGMQGVLGTLSVAALSTIENYQALTPSTDQ